MSANNSFINSLMRSVSTTALLGSVAFGGMIVGQLRPAHAEPDSCTIVGNVATCTGDQSDGILSNRDFDPDSVDTLNVNNLTTGITPASSEHGINFLTDNPLGITINADTTGTPGITTTGNNAKGIRARLIGDGDVNINSTGDVSTAGDDSYGIYGISEGVGDISITSTGNVVTTGVDSDGIYARNFGIGNVNIISEGGISTTSDDAEGIHVQQFTDGNVNITSLGDVKTIGDGAEGIRVRRVGDGNSTVNSDGNIMTEGDNSYGIYALSEGLGNNTVTSTGAIDTSGDDAIGIYVRGFGEGDITITSTGDISTTGDDAEGIYAQNNDGGNIIVTSTGNISTAAEGAEGIRALGYGGDVSVNSYGDISTLDEFSEGIEARNEGDSGDVTVSSVGNITTGGFYAQGIEARNDGDGDVTITSVGDITTTGSEGGQGILAADRGEGSVSVTSTGNISTTGRNSYGIEASNRDEGNVIISSTGNITTEGNYAYAIYAENSGDGYVSVTSTGNISTSGSQAYGIYAISEGDITVTSEGNISTTGGFGGAIYAKSEADGVITINSEGNLSTSGRGAVGIYAEANGVGGISITNNGDILATSRNIFFGRTADGILARTSDDGDINVNSIGNITASGNNANGVTATIGGAGIVTVTLSGGAVQGGSRNGAGVNFSSGIGGANNTLNNSASNLSALSGVAVLGGAGNETINNFGTITGDVNLGSGTDTVNLDADSTFSDAVFDGEDDADIFRLSGTGTSTLDGAQHRNFETLIKEGTGTFSMTGTHSFANGTTVSGGALLVNGMLDTSMVEVDTGGTLGGGGTISGAVNINAGGTLSAGNSPGTLTVGDDLTLDGNSTSNFELGQANSVGGDDNDLVEVGGNASIAGTLNLSNGNGGAAVSGFYTLFDVAGTTTGEFSNTTNGGVVSTISQIITNGGSAPSEFNVLVNNGDQIVQFWDGTGVVSNGAVDGGSGAWNTDNTNWTDVDGGINAPWQEGVAIFGGTAGNVTIADAQNFEGLQFAVDGYVISGATLNATGDSAVNSSASFLNAITGTTTIASDITGDANIGIEKLGGGTIILTGTNTFTGTTTVSGGTLSLTGAGTLASTDINITNGTFQSDGGALHPDAVVGLTGGAFQVDGDETIAALQNSGGIVDIDLGQTLSSTEVVNENGATISNAGILTAINQIQNNIGGTLTNTGVVNGDINNTGTINASGTFNGAVTNSGSFQPGGTGSVGSAIVTGSIVQTQTGSLIIDLDATSGTVDLVTVIGPASLAGTVDVNLFNTLPVGTFTILTASDGVTDNGLGLGTIPNDFANPLAEIELLFPNANDVALGFILNAALGNFNPNQTSILNNINAANGAGVGDLALIIGALFGLGSVEETAGALDQLSPEIYLGNETSTLFAAEAFADQLFSCQLGGEEYSAISEGNCLWVRPQGRLLDRDQTANNIGFEERVVGLSVGGQKEFKPDWFAGFALGYENGDLETDGTGASSQSDRFHAGLSLKHTQDAFAVSGAVIGGFSHMKTTRNIGFGNLAAVSTSDHDIAYLGGQLRAAYLVEQGGYYAKPLIDLNLTYLASGGFNENGNPATNLVIEDSSDIFFSVTPGVEFGFEHHLATGNQTIRGYVKGGASIYANDEHALTASFAGAPAGTPGFEIASEIDGIFADLEAGISFIKNEHATLQLGYQGRISENINQQGVFFKATQNF